MTELNLSRKIKAILKGWSNYATDSGDHEILAKARARICAQCPHAVKGKMLAMIKDELKEIEGMKCDLCGCPLSAKVRQSVELCDLKKW